MTRRATRPHSPVLTPTLQREREQHQQDLRKAEKTEQRSVLRGLLLLAVLLAVFALFRFGGAIFAGGGWRRW